MCAADIEEELADATVDRLRRCVEDNPIRILNIAESRESLVRELARLAQHRVWQAKTPAAGCFDVLTRSV